MAEKVPGLVLLLICYLRISPEKQVSHVHVTNRYQSKLIKAALN